MPCGLFCRFEEARWILMTVVFSVGICQTHQNLKTKTEVTFDNDEINVNWGFKKNSVDKVNLAKNKSDESNTDDISTDKNKIDDTKRDKNNYNKNVKDENNREKNNRNKINDEEFNEGDKISVKTNADKKNVTEVSKNNYTFKTIMNILDYIKLKQGTLSGVNVSKYTKIRGESVTNKNDDKPLKELNLHARNVSQSKHTLLTNVTKEKSVGKADHNGISESAKWKNVGVSLRFEEDNYDVNVNNDGRKSTVTSDILITKETLRSRYKAQLAKKIRDGVNVTSPLTNIDDDGRNVTESNDLIFNSHGNFSLKGEASRHNLKKRSNDEFPSKHKITRSNDLPLEHKINEEEDFTIDEPLQREVDEAVDYGLEMMRELKDVKEPLLYKLGKLLDKLLFEENLHFNKIIFFKQLLFFTNSWF